MNFTNNKPSVMVYKYVRKFFDTPVFKRSMLVPLLLGVHWAQQLTSNKQNMEEIDKLWRLGHTEALELPPWIPCSRGTLLTFCENTQTAPPPGPRIKEMSSFNNHERSEVSKQQSQEQAVLQAEPTTPGKPSNAFRWGWHLDSDFFRDPKPEMPR